MRRNLSHHSVLATLVGLVGLAVACSGPAPPAPSPSSPPPAPSSTLVAQTPPGGSPPPPIVPPSASAPSAITPSAVASPVSSGPVWQEIGTVGRQVGGGVIGTPGGYFAYGHDLDVAFSTDGRAWQSFELPPSAPGCPGDQVDAIEAAAGDGRMLVVLGAYTNAQCRLQTFAWSSADGRTWHRSQPFGEQRGFSEARAVDLWPVPGGWEAAIAAYDVAADTGHTAIWHSPDGMRWAPESVLDAHGSVDGAADADGRRVLAVTASFTRTSGPRAEQVALAWSADGMTWRQLALPAARRSLDSVVWRVLPPGAGRASWILASTQYPPDDDPRTTLWTSIDLTGWVPLALPEHALYSIDSASIGVVLTGCDGNAVECTHYIARNDATGWTEIEIPSSERYWRHIADGPAGVLMVLEDGAVYRLVE